MKLFSFAYKDNNHCPAGKPLLAASTQQMLINIQDNSLGNHNLMRHVASRQLTSSRDRHLNGFRPGKKNSSRAGD
jgi:hypothetical protein